MSVEVICFKRLLNRLIRKSLRAYNTGRHFELDILLDGEVLRLRLRQLVKENIYGAFIGLVVLSGFAGVQQVQKRDEVPFLRLRLIPDVTDQRGIIEAFRL